MRRIITGEPGEVDFNMITVPDTAAITITENCGECAWLNTFSRHKPSCNNPSIKAARPYVSQVPPDQSGLVQLSSRPDWCPLDKPKAVANPLPEEGPATDVAYIYCPMCGGETKDLDGDIICIAPGSCAWTCNNDDTHCSYPGCPVCGGRS